MIRRVVYSTAIVLLGMTTGFSVASAKGKSLPKEFNLKKMSGENISGEKFKDKYLAIQIWASWCVSCSKTMVDIGSIIDAEKLPIHFLAVSVDEDLSSANAYFNKPDKSEFNQKLKGAKKFAYLDEGSSLSEALGIEAVPTVFIVAPDGSIARVILGHPSEKDFTFLRNLVVKKA